MPRDKRQTIEAIERLRAEGYTIGAIAQHLGYAWATIATICSRFKIPKRAGKMKKVVSEGIAPGLDSIDDFGGTVSPKET